MVDAVVHRVREVLLRRLAAVYDQGVPDGEGGCIRTKPEDRIGDLFGPAHSADWLLRNHLRPTLGSAAGEAIHHRRIDVARADGVHANVLRGGITRTLNSTSRPTMAGSIWRLKATMRGFNSGSTSRTIW